MEKRASRKWFDDDLSADKCKSRVESHEAVAATVTASQLVADQVSMIKIGSTPKYSNINPTCNTDKPNHFKPPMHLKIAVKI